VSSTATAIKDALQSAMPERRVVALQAADVTATDVLGAISSMAAVNREVRFTTFGAEYMKVRTARFDSRFRI
jgi:hypothetical protein